MHDGAYARRLAEDLPKWRQAGWVTEGGAVAIRAGAGAGAGAKRSAFGMAAIVGTIGALLTGLGVIAFVAANWEGMPRIYRFGVLILALALAYVAAGAFQTRGFRVFSEAALLIAGLVFAAAIALIGQTYHLAGDFSGAIMLWEAGMIVAALLTGSSVLTMLAVIGGGYWVWLSTVENNILPHWPSLAVILLGGAIATVLNAQYSRLVAILAFGFWVAVTTIAYATHFNLPFTGTLALLATAALAVWAIGAALATFDPQSRVGGLGLDMQWPALAAMLAALGLEQTVGLWGDTHQAQAWVMPAFILGVAAVLLASYGYMRRSLSAIEPIAVAVISVAAIGFALWTPPSDLQERLAGGAIVLVAALWVTSLGQTAQHRGKTLGLFAFGAEILYLYVVTLGTQIDTALAFLAGGVLFIALAYGLFRLDRFMTRRADPPALPLAVAPPPMTPAGALPTAPAPVPAADVPPAVPAAVVGPAPGAAP
ncbi:MAG: DUF2157 domain-containing protein [Bauldia sp.]